MTKAVSGQNVTSILAMFARYLCTITHAVPRILDATLTFLVTLASESRGRFHPLLRDYRATFQLRTWLGPCGFWTSFDHFLLSSGKIKHHPQMRCSPQQRLIAQVRGAKS